MSVLKGLTLLVVVSQVLSRPATDKSEDQVYNAQVLNYQLQQLGLQQLDGLSLQVQTDEYDTQPVQFPTVEPQVITTQSQEITGADISYLQHDILQSAIQAQINSQQPVTTQTINVSPQQQQQQQQQPQPQPQQQRLQQQQQHLQQQDQPKNLLGIAYSSAPEASRTSFSGFGVKYSF